MPSLYVWNCLLVNKIDFIPVVVATTLLSSEIYLVRLFFVFLCIKKGDTCAKCRYLYAFFVCLELSPCE